MTDDNPFGAGFLKAFTQHGDTLRAGAERKAAERLGEAGRRAEAEAAAESRSAGGARRFGGVAGAVVGKAEKARSGDDEAPAAAPAPAPWDYGRPLRFGGLEKAVFERANVVAYPVRSSDLAGEAALLAYVERQARDIAASCRLAVRPERPTMDDIVEAFDRYSMEIRDAAAQAMAPLVREMYPDARFDRLQPALFDAGDGKRRIGWAYEMRGDAGAAERVDGRYFVGGEAESFRAYQRIRLRAAFAEALDARREFEAIEVDDSAEAQAATTEAFYRMLEAGREACDRVREGGRGAVYDDAEIWGLMDAAAPAEVETPELRPFPLLLFVLEWLRLPKLRRVGARDALLCSPAVMQALYGAPIAPALAGVDRVNARAGLLDGQAASWPPARFLAQSGAPAKERVKKLDASHK